MILDHIDNIENYKGISKNMDTAIDFIIGNDLSDFSVGKYSVDGDDVFFVVQENEAKDVEEGSSDTRNKYIDIQYIINGQELIGCAPGMLLSVVEEYNASKDKIIFVGTEERRRLTECMFGIYFSEDEHVQSVDDEKVIVKKAVFKIRL